MNSDQEKPLLKVGGRPMVRRVLEALVRSKRFSRIVAVVSPETPDTEKYLKSLEVEVFASDGGGFSKDLSSFLRSCKPEEVFVVPADLALIDEKHVKSIADKAGDIKNYVAISIVCDLDFVQKLGLQPSVILNDAKDPVCHSGITVFNTIKIPDGEEAVPEDYLTMNSVGVAVNVNTKKELGLAEKLLVQRPKHFTK